MCKTKVTISFIILKFYTFNKKKGYAICKLEINILSFSFSNIQYFLLTTTVCAIILNNLGGNSPFVPSDLNPSTDDHSKSSPPSNIQGIELYHLTISEMFWVCNIFIFITKTFIVVITASLFGIRDKRDIIIEKHIALYFVQYSECLSNPPFLLCYSDNLPFYKFKDLSQSRQNIGILANREILIPFNAPLVQNLFCRDRPDFCSIKTRES